MTVAVRTSLAAHVVKRKWLVSLRKGAEQTSMMHVDGPMRRGVLVDGKRGLRGHRLRVCRHQGT